MKIIERQLSVVMRKQANVDVVNLTVDELLAQLPDADVIRISLYSFKDDDE